MKGPHTHSIRDVAEVMLKLLGFDKADAKVFAAIILGSATDRGGYFELLRERLAQGTEHARRARGIEDLAKWNLYAYVGTITDQPHKIHWGRYPQP